MVTHDKPCSTALDFFEFVNAVLCMRILGHSSIFESGSDERSIGSFFDFLGARTKDAFGHAKCFASLGGDRIYMVIPCQPGVSCDTKVLCGFNMC